MVISSPTRDFRTTLNPVIYSKHEQPHNFLFGSHISILGNSYQRNTDDIPYIPIFFVRWSEESVHLAMVFLENNANLRPAPIWL
jgi:hypothetical protein